MNTDHGTGHLIVELPDGQRFELPIFWELLEGKLEDGASWMAEVRGIDMFTCGLGKRILQTNSRCWLELETGLTLTRAIVHNVIVNSYGTLEDDIPLDDGGPYLGSAHLLLASPDHPRYTPRPPFSLSSDENDEVLKP